MSCLRDICLQVRYDGNAQVLVERFFAPVSRVAIIHKVRVATLTKEALLPIALALSETRASRAKLQILLSLSPNPAAAGVNALFPTNGELQQELLRNLSEISTNPEGENALPSDRFEVMVCPFNEQNKVVSSPVSEVTGFLTDETGASVSYIANWDSGLAASRNERGMLVAWSWGDPQFKVKNEIAEFDRLWKGDSNESQSFVAEDALKQKLLVVLLTLAATPTFDESIDEAIKLFEHQEKAVKALVERTFRGVFKMCTGAGKTISALAAVQVLSEKRASSSLPLPPVIVSVPTRVLADQWIREIKRFGFQSVLSAYNAFEQWYHLLEPVLRAKNLEQPRFVVTTYRTFADDRFITKLKRAGELGVEAFWIADEMHNLASSRLRDAMRKCERLFQFRLGLSATPEIEGDLTATESLLGYFGNICASYELADGIRDGVLCQYRYFPVPAYLAPSHGKKYLSLLQEISEEAGGSTALINLYRETRDLLRTSGVQVARFRDLINDLMQSAPELKHTLIYCPPGYGSYGGDVSDEIDKDEDERRLIEEVIEVLRSKNLSPASILGETPADQRSQILERFAEGRVRSLCAIGCLDEGVDVPTIQRAIVLYSVDREKQFIQRRGRILRQPRGVRGKIAEIYDIVILPQGADMPRSQAEALLNREMRRYREFARLAINRQQADAAISNALSVVTCDSLNPALIEHAS
jgi:superfamily II DNA or RNA helicase